MCSYVHSGQETVNVATTQPTQSISHKIQGIGYCLVVHIPLLSELLGKKASSGLCECVVLDMYP